MKHYTLFLLVGLALAPMAQTSRAEPPAAGKHTPEPGDVVVVYRNQFKPDKFSEGTKVLSDILKKVAFEDAAVRDCYVLKNKEDSTTMGVVMWDSKKEFENWKQSGKGKAIGEALAEFQAKPVEIEEYVLFMVDDE